MGAAVTLAVVGTDDEEPDEATALAVFERNERRVDDPSNLIIPLDQIIRDVEGSLLPPGEEVELRWVGSPAGYEAYVLRWRDDAQAMVCMIVEAPDQVVSGCATEAEFVKQGLRLVAFGLDVKWGPDGSEVWVNSFR